MPDKPWDEMQPDEKVEWLHRELFRLINFINHASLPQIGQRLDELAARMKLVEEGLVRTEEGATTPATLAAPKLTK
jgi:hypothetical protein